MIRSYHSEETYGTETILYYYRTPTNKSLIRNLYQNMHVDLTPELDIEVSDFLPV